MKETELAEYLIPWLEKQHWEVYQEVPYGGGAIDILAVRDFITWAIEVKTSFGLTVLEQASSRRMLYRSIFVPSSISRGRRAYQLAKNFYKVGVIELDKWERVWQVHKAPLIREHYECSKGKLATLTEEHKTYCKAGTKNGSRLTPYRESMDGVQRFIRTNPGCNITDIFNHLGKRHYASEQSFRQSVIHALCTFENWCEVDKDARPYKFSVRKS